jgi:hypothetical protein
MRSLILHFLLERRLPPSNRIAGMPKLERGLYEVLITEALEAHLQGLGERVQALRTSLRTAEAADRVALHLSRIIQRSLSAVGDQERVEVSIALARALLQQIDATVRGGNATMETPIVYLILSGSRATS